MPQMIPISAVSDPRLAPFLNLKDRDLSREGNRFLVEGELLVRRLLASRFQCQCILASESRVARIASDLPETIDVYIVSDDLMMSTLGYKFHSGIMAIAVKPAPLSLEALLSAGPLVVGVELANTENLGSILRICAAMGASGLLLDEKSADPFYRQSVRVSMGSALTLPIRQSHEIAHDLQSLRTQHGYRLIAAALDADSVPLQELPCFPRNALLVGNEAQGIPEPIKALCDVRCAIPMQLGTDSLNVAIATAVFLYELTRPV